MGGSRYHPISAAAHHTVIPVKVWPEGNDRVCCSASCVTQRGLSRPTLNFTRLPSAILPADSARKKMAKGHAHAEARTRTAMAIKAMLRAPPNHARNSASENSHG